MNRLQTLLASKKFQKALPWAAGAILALGVITLAIVLGLFAVRLVRWAAFDRERRTIVLGVLLAGLLLEIGRAHV